MTLRFAIMPPSFAVRVGVLPEGGGVALDDMRAKSSVKSGNAEAITLLWSGPLRVIRPRVERAATAPYEHARRREDGKCSLGHSDRCGSRMRDSKTLPGKRSRNAAAARLASSIRPMPESA